MDAAHPIIEPRRNSEHARYSNFKALGSCGETVPLYVAAQHPLSAGRLANASTVPNLVSVLNVAWASKVLIFRLFMQEAGLRRRLLPVLISTLKGEHPKPIELFSQWHQGFVDNSKFILNCYPYYRK